MSVLEKVRKWIDGESAELILEEAARDAQVKPRSKSEEFIVKIARSVEDVMQNEMVPLPQGTTIIPTEYIIFLSNEDDREWQGIKRKGLEQGLYHILAERAKEISGKRKLETKTFAVELRVDGTLQKGDVRVQHSWEDSADNKTGVFPRQKMPNDSTATRPSEESQPPAPTVAMPPLSTPFAQSNQPSPATQPNYAQHPTSPHILPTVPQFNASQSIPPSIEEGEEMTHVQKRQTELYRLEIWRGGVRQSVLPIYEAEISIGRGSKSKPVTIALEGDPEISRRHARLQTDGKGNFWFVNEGRNPAIVNDYELPSNQKVSVAAGVPIGICSYLLRIQAK